MRSRADKTRVKPCGVWGAGANGETQIKRFWQSQLILNSTRFASWGPWNDWGALARDRSLHGADLTPAGGPPLNRASNTNHAPTSNIWTSAVTVATVVRLSNASATNRFSTFVHKGQSGNRMYSLLYRVDGVNWLVRVLIDNVPTLGLDTVPPGLSATDQAYYCAHSMGPNPASTGTSDAALSAVYVWNLETGALATHAVAHAYPTAVSNQLHIGTVSTGGGDLFGEEGFGSVEVHAQALTRAQIESRIPYIRALAGV